MEGETVINVKYIKLDSISYVYDSHEIISLCDMRRPYLGYRVQGDQP